MTALMSKLVGMSFYRHALEFTKIIREKSDPQKPLPVLLVREPENQYDPNAIAVYIKLGHVERDKAAILADTMEALGRENLRWTQSSEIVLDGSGTIMLSTEADL